MEKEEIVKNVVEQVINMLSNNVIEDNGSESFECWCADGEVFENNGIEDVDKHCEIVSVLAPYVDALSNAIDNLIYQK